MNKFTAAIALATCAAQLPVAAASTEEIVIVDVAPVAPELAAHLRVGPDKIPVTVNLPSKLAAVVCEVSLKQLRDSKGINPNSNCVAIGMSQGLIQAVRQEMKKK